MAGDTASKKDSDGQMCFYKTKLSRNAEETEQSHFIKGTL